MWNIFWFVFLCAKYIFMFFVLSPHLFRILRGWIAFRKFGGTEPLRILRGCMVFCVGVGYNTIKQTYYRATKKTFLYEYQTKNTHHHTTTKNVLCKSAAFFFGLCMGMSICHRWRKMTTARRFRVIPFLRPMKITAALLFLDHFLRYFDIKNHVCTSNLFSAPIFLFLIYLLYSLDVNVLFDLILHGEHVKNKIFYIWAGRASFGCFS